MMSSVTTLLPALSLIFVIQKTSASVPGFTGMMVHVTMRLRTVKTVVRPIWMRVRVIETARRRAGSGMAPHAMRRPAVITRAPVQRKLSAKATEDTGMTASAMHRRNAANNVWKGVIIF